MSLFLIYSTEYAGTTGVTHSAANKDRECGQEQTV